MYDSIRIVLECPDTHCIVRGLDELQTRYRHDLKTVSHIGKCGTLRVKVTEKRLTIRGSLSKFTGLKETTRRDVLDALRQLEEMLGVSLAEARVFRVDVFNDLELAEHPAAYFPLLLAYPRLQHYSYFGTSVGFAGKSRSIKFYDKDAEQEKSHVPTAGPLRVEVAWLNDLSGQIKRKLYVSDLAAPDVWHDFVRRWLKEYRTVEKARSMLPLDSAASTLKLALAAKGLEAYGLSNVLRDLEKRRDRGEIVGRDYNRRRRYLIDLASDPRYTARSARLNELDAAVEQAAEAMHERGV